MPGQPRADEKSPPTPGWAPHLTRWPIPAPVPYRTEDMPRALSVGLEGAWDKCKPPPNTRVVHGHMFDRRLTVFHDLQNNGESDLNENSLYCFPEAQGASRISGNSQAHQI